MRSRIDAWNTGTKNHSRRGQAKRNPAVGAVLLGIESLEDRWMLAIDLSTVVQNLDFEDYTTLPAQYSQMYDAGDTVDHWSQLSAATTDYLHTSGFVGHPQGAGIATPPPNGSHGFIGVHAINPPYSEYYPDGWHEYALNVLDQPLTPGVEYVLDLYAGTNTFAGPGAGAFRGQLVLYGLIDADLFYEDPAFKAPFWNYGEFRPIELFGGSNYVELLAVGVDQPGGTWTSFPSQSFTTPVAIEALVFGARSDPGALGYPYLLIDAAGAPVIDPEGLPPKVTEVAISGPNPLDGVNGTYVVPTGSGEQLRTIPVGGANKITITFSEPVNVAHGDLELLSARGYNAYNVVNHSTFSLSADKRTATWTFNYALPTDQIVLTLNDTVTDLAGNHLDGEWTNPTSLNQGSAGLKRLWYDRSGNGVAGGDFVFYFTSMPGDVFGEVVFDYGTLTEYYRLNNMVTIADFRHWKEHRTDIVGPPLDPTPSFYEGDATGDGDVDLPDYELVIHSLNLDFRLWPTPPFPPPPVPVVSADFDLDGDVDGRDFLTWQRGYGSGTTRAEGDSDGDGDVDGVDLTHWTNQYGEQSFANADVNSDESIDEQDLAALVVGYGMTAGATLADGDANGDGDVDLDDYLAWEIQYGTATQSVDWYENALDFDVNTLGNGQVIVTSSEDENDGNYSLGDLSLREALALVAESDATAIAFANVALGEIVLTQGALSINSDVTIAGPGADLLAISGNQQSSVFQIASGVTATIRDLTITAGSGGGVGNQGILTLDRVSVENNLGGGIIVSAGSLTVNNSTVANNTGATTGGGIMMGTGSLAIVNSTISNNSASSVGGGIFAFSGGVNILNSTISANRSNLGSGIYSVAPVTIHNSIVANNLAYAGTPTTNDLNGSFGSSSYNLIGVGGGFTNGVNGNIVLGAGVNAGLTALGNFGGSMQVHALLSTSPALDAGSNANVPVGITDDQRGLNRFVDVGTTGPTGGTVDIGAFEAGNANSFLVTTLVDESDGNLAANDISLREAIALASSILGIDTILFAPSLTAGGAATITLTYDGPDSGTTPDRLTLNSNVTIDGPGANLLAISGNNQTRVLHVDSGVSATIRGLRITGGHGGDYGGGIYSSGSLTVDRSQIESNWAASSGGGVYVQGGTFTLSNSTVASNFANYQGGGLYVGTTSSPALIANSTISSNTATYGGGGGIYDASSGAVIVNGTITANATSYGAAAGIQGNSTKLFNTIVAANTGNKDLAGSFHSTSAYNLIGYDSSLTNGINHGTNGNQVGGQSGAPAIDPKLSTLGYYGGTVKTHRLLSASTAIDAGDNAVAVAYGLDEDARGLDRIVDWDGTGGDTVDLGAVELAFGEIYT